MTQVPPPSPQVPPPVAAMQTQCPHCGHAYAVSAEEAAAMAGRSFACTACGQPFTLSPSGAAFVQPAQHVAYASGAHVKSNPLAIASLICGCLLCVPFVPGIGSIVCGAIGMRKTRDPAVTGKGMAIAGLVLGIINVLAWGAYFGLIFAIMVPTLGVARQTANQVKCAQNLRQLGLAIQLYANQNGGAFPATIESLLDNPALGVSSALYDCPVTPASPPSATSSQALAGKAEFVYVGKGLTSSSPPNAVVAYEPLSNHGTGSNVLYADGTVNFMPMAQVEQMIKQLEAGVNPPSVVAVPAPVLVPVPATAPANAEEVEP
jgi:predicted Zn finger-like uncharacterized protein/prepilin-type processing-associated H-X9-DG protein